MKCEKCGEIGIKMNNGTVAFICGGYRFTNGESFCGRVLWGPDNRDRVLKVYRELRGLAIDNAEYLKELEKSEAIVGRKNVIMNQDGSCGALRRRTKKKQ